MRDYVRFVLTVDNGHITEGADTEMTDFVAAKCLGTTQRRCSQRFLDGQAHRKTRKLHSERH
jgi:hypothetical protein